MGLASLLAVWIAPRTFRTVVGWDRNGAITAVGTEPPRYLVAILILWAGLEVVNALVPLWRYTLLPDFLPFRVVWLGMLGPTLVGGAWTAGKWLSVGDGRGYGRKMNAFTTVLAVFAWLTFLAFLGRAARAGAQLNTAALAPSPGTARVLTGLLAGALLLVSAFALAPLARRLTRLALPRARVVGAAATVCALVVGASFNVASGLPDLRDLPGALPSQIESLPVWGVPSVRALAGWTPDALAERVPGIEEAEADAVIGAARLFLHRGIGAPRGRALWGLGIRRPEDLSGRDPRGLGDQLDGSGAPRTPGAWLRDWLR
jgi:hypothetical protein